MLNIIKQVLKDIFSRGNVHIDGVCYVLMSVFPFVTAYLSTQEARQYVPLKVLFWSCLFLGIFNLTVTSIKNFRSTAFADSAARNGSGKTPTPEPLKKDETMTKTVQTVLTFAILFAVSFSSFAQTPIVDPGAPSQVSGTNAPTNPLQLVGAVLPSYDPTLTNTFRSHDLFVSVTPLWKTQTASGSTPYLSTSAGYFFTQHLGAEAELVTLGDGKGNSDLDSAAVLFLMRKDVGNLAGYLMAGPSYDHNRSKLCADVGLGFEYRYRNNLGVFVDTRYSYGGQASEDNGFKTRAGIRLTF